MSSIRRFLTGIAGASPDAPPTEVVTRDPARRDSAVRQLVSATAAVPEWPTEWSHAAYVASEEAPGESQVFLRPALVDQLLAETPEEQERMIQQSGMPTTGAEMVMAVRLWARALRVPVRWLLDVFEGFKRPGRPVEWIHPHKNADIEAILMGWMLVRMPEVTARFNVATAFGWEFIPSGQLKPQGSLQGLPQDFLKAEHLENQGHLFVDCGGGGAKLDQHGRVENAVRNEVSSLHLLIASCLDHAPALLRLIPLVEIVVENDLRGDAVASGFNVRDLVEGLQMMGLGDQQIAEQIFLAYDAAARAIDARYDRVLARHGGNVAARKTRTALVDERLAPLLAAIDTMVIEGDAGDEADEDEMEDGDEAEESAASASAVDETVIWEELRRRKRSVLLIKNILAHLPERPGDDELLSESRREAAYMAEDAARAGQPLAPAAVAQLVQMALVVKRKQAETLASRVERFVALCADAFATREADFTKAREDMKQARREIGAVMFRRQTRKAEEPWKPAHDQVLVAAVISDAQALGRVARLERNIEVRAVAAAELAHQLRIEPDARVLKRVLRSYRGATVVVQLRDVERGPGGTIAKYRFTISTSGIDLTDIAAEIRPLLLKAAGFDNPLHGTGGRALLGMKVRASNGNEVALDFFPEFRTVYGNWFKSNHGMPMTTLDVTELMRAVTRGLARASVRFAAELKEGERIPSLLTPVRGRIVRMLGRG